MDKKEGYGRFTFADHSTFEVTLYLICQLCMVMYSLQFVRVSVSRISQEVKSDVQILMKF